MLCDCLAISSSSTDQLLVNFMYCVTVNVIFYKTRVFFRKVTAVSSKFQNLILYSVFCILYSAVSAYTVFSTVIWYRTSYVYRSRGQITTIDLSSNETVFHPLNFFITVARVLLWKTLVNHNLRKHCTYCTPLPYYVGVFMQQRMLPLYTIAVIGDSTSQSRQHWNFLNHKCIFTR